MYNNNSFILQIILVLTVWISGSSCKKEIAGCMDQDAANYDPQATISNDSCIFPGCNDVLAANYDASANEDDGSCYYYAQVTFWSKNNQPTPVYIYLDGEDEPAGELTSTSADNTEPPCGDNSVGHTITLEHSGYTFYEWHTNHQTFTRNFYVEKNDCIIVELPD